MLKYKGNEVAIAPDGSCEIIWGENHPTMAGQRQGVHLPREIKSSLVAVNQYLMQYVDRVTEPVECKTK